MLRCGSTMGSKFINTLTLSAVALLCLSVVVRGPNWRRATGASLHGASGKLYFVGDPNATDDLSPWERIQMGDIASYVSDTPKGLSPGGSVSIVSDPLATQEKVYKLTVTPSADFAAYSAKADFVALWNNADPYMGQEGQETWEHFRVLFRSAGESYKPAPGMWNWVVEHHNDSKYIPFLRSGAIVSERPELAWGVSTTAKLPSGKIGEELFMVVRGGDDRHSEQLESEVYADSPLLYDHWYDMLVHVIWSHQAQRGLVEWWLDGKLVTS